jgi:hypothetical protein
MTFPPDDSQTNRLFLFEVRVGSGCQIINDQPKPRLWRLHMTYKSENLQSAGEHSFIRHIEMPQTTKFSNHSEIQLSSPVRVYRDRAPFAGIHGVVLRPGDPLHLAFPPGIRLELTKGHDRWLKRGGIHKSAQPGPKKCFERVYRSKPFR